MAAEREQAIFVLKQLYGYFDKHFERLPKAFISREQRWSRRQIVVDYVAGLTDSYAVQLFCELFVPPVGFVYRR